MSSCITNLSMTICQRPKECIMTWKLRKTQAFHTYIHCKFFRLNQKVLINSHRLMKHSRFCRGSSCDGCPAEHQGEHPATQNKRHSTDHCPPQNKRHCKHKAWGTALSTGRQMQWGGQIYPLKRREFHCLSGEQKLVQRQQWQKFWKMAYAHKGYPDPSDASLNESQQGNMTDHCPYALASTFQAPHLNKATVQGVQDAVKYRPQNNWW